MSPDEGVGVMLVVVVGAGGVVVSDDGGELGGVVRVVGPLPPLGVVPDGSAPPGGRVAPVLETRDDGENVTVSRPSGPTLMVVVGDEDESAVVDELSSVVESVSGAVLWGATCWEPGLSLPPSMPGVVFEGAASWAMPPKAVASTTPLIASRR